MHTSFYLASTTRLLPSFPTRRSSDPTGRQPLYHIRFDERPEWAYAQEPLVPLKGYPGVLWNRSKKKRRSDEPPLRSEEHTSELQSLRHLVCRLLLEKKKKIERIISD